MKRLIDVYRVLHQQAFIPIFVRDHIPDSKKLIEGCLEAGMRVIEYTQRQLDAPTMIPCIRKIIPTYIFWSAVPWTMMQSSLNNG